MSFLQKKIFVLVIIGNKISKYQIPLENLTSGPLSASQTGNSENSLQDLLLVISPNVLIMFIKKNSLPTH